MICINITQQIIIVGDGQDKERKRERKPTNSTHTLTYRMTDSSDNNSSLGWHTDPENPMLGPDGQLHDTHDRPQQFVHSPLDTVANTLHLHTNAEDDLYLLCSKRMQAMSGQS